MHKSRINPDAEAYEASMRNFRPELASNSQVEKLLKYARGRVKRRKDEVQVRCQVRLDRALALADHLGIQDGQPFEFPGYGTQVIFTDQRVGHGQPVRTINFTGPHAEQRVSYSEGKLFRAINELALLRDEMHSRLPHQYPPVRTDQGLLADGSFASRLTMARKKVLHDEEIVAYRRQRNTEYEAGLMPEGMTYADVQEVMDAPGLSTSERILAYADHTRVPDGQVFTIPRHGTYTTYRAEGGRYVKVHPFRVNHVLRYAENALERSRAELQAFEPVKPVVQYDLSAEPRWY